MKKFIVTFLTLFFVYFAYSQTTDFDKKYPDAANTPYWIEMMQDPDVNFFDIQKAFNLYWEEREVTKGCGYKQFRRWEYDMQFLVDAEGNLPKGNIYANAYKKSLKNYRYESAGNWEEIGPIKDPVEVGRSLRGYGRVNAIGFHPTDSTKIYVGAPTGGFWLTDDYGQTWKTSSDTIPAIGVSSIVVNKDHPDTIYIGTGDRVLGDMGNGVMLSADGGLTWQTKNTGMGELPVCMLVMHPDSSNILIAATKDGIYKTTDCAENWTRVLNSKEKHRDIEYKPGDPSVVYAEGNGKLYISENYGNTWEVVSDNGTSNLPDANRLVIGVSPANPDVVYCLSTSGEDLEGFYKSTDAGKTFTLQSTSPDIIGWQGWYNLAIAVDPLDENTIYGAGVYIYKSTDGGNSWTKKQGINHVDIHALEFSPANGKLFNGNDGGVGYTNDGGADNWNDISQGLGITQIYRVGMSAKNRDSIIIGTQDNGTALYSDNEFFTLISGDGTDCMFDYENSNYVYFSNHEGGIKRSKDGGKSFESMIANISEKGGWVTPFILDNQNPNTIYTGFQSIWRYDSIRNYDKSVTWKQISTPISAQVQIIEQSPANPDVMYVSYYKSSFYHTKDLSSDEPIWNISPFVSASPPVTDVAASPTNEGTVYMTKTDQVLKSTDYGFTWKDITGNIPTEIPIQTLVVDSTGEDEAIYVGTMTSVYYKDASMTDWILFSNGLPTSEVRELQIYYDKENRKNSRLRAATYGRGLWESTLYPKAVVSLENTNENIDNNNFNLFPNPTEGELTLEIKAKTNESTNLIIYSTNGQVVKNIPIELKNGINTFSINLTGISKGIYQININFANEQSLSRQIILK